VDVGRRWQSSRFAWAERERARELGKGRKWERGGGRPGRGAWTWSENARTWAHPWRGDHGREVEDELTGGDGGTKREGAGARQGNSADRSGPRDREREGERRDRVGADMRDPPVRQRGRAGARAGWA
jgi:hypothetical protein